MTAAAERGLSGSNRPSRGSHRPGRVAVQDKRGDGVWLLLLNPRSETLRSQWRSPAPVCRNDASPGLWRETLQRFVISATPSASSPIPTARCRPSFICLPRALSDDRADRIDRIDANERAEATEQADPMERTEHAEPIEPIERTEPTEPIDSSEPSLAIDRSDPDD